MTDQIQITTPDDLLDENGLLTSPGYATQPVWKYDRSKIKAGWHRIKEWDYYAVLNLEKGYGVTCTIADLGYIGMAAICWLDFNHKTFSQKDILTLLPRGKTGFPADSDQGSVSIQAHRISLTFSVKNHLRRLVIDAPEFVGPNNEKGLAGELTLQQDPSADSMVIASAWKENPKAFYYNRKINCLPATGEIKLGSHLYAFSPETSYGTLDWGRGNWTYRNRWYWGSASGMLNGKPLGWNLGYGFSDRSTASENMIFYDGNAHKLSDVSFHFNSKDYLSPWRVTSADNRFEMDFQPIVDRNSATNLLIIKSVQHQVFGYFTGYVILDNNQRLEVTRLLGFAEDVLNWW